MSAGRGFNSTSRNLLALPAVILNPVRWVHAFGLKLVNPSYQVKLLHHLIAWELLGELFLDPLQLSR